MNNISLGVYKISGQVAWPEYATAGSAAFDLRLFLGINDIPAAVDIYDNYNMPGQILPDPGGKIKIYPGWRAKLPTGLIFDIPEGYWLSVNLRGGTAYKKGLVLSNSTGIVDWDYVDETFVVVTNTTNTPVILEDGERIAQAKLELSVPTSFVPLDTAPSKKTTRSGGFNSTGIR